MFVSFFTYFDKVGDQRGLVFKWIKITWNSIHNFTPFFWFHLVSMVRVASHCLKQPLYMFSLGTFQSKHLEIKQAFKTVDVLYPVFEAAWFSCFSTNQYGFNTFCTGRIRNISANLSLNKSIIVQTLRCKETKVLNMNFKFVGK